MEQKIYYQVDGSGYMSGPYTEQERNRSCEANSAQWIMYPDTPEGRAKGEADQIAAVEYNRSRF